LKASFIGGRPPVDWSSPTSFSRLGDRRAGQPGALGEVGAGGAVALADQLQQRVRADRGVHALRLRLHAALAVNQFELLLVKHTEVSAWKPQRTRFRMTTEQLLLDTGTKVS
jgi:hypothetical protein